MVVKGLKEEDFSNYRKPAMFIITPFCTFKCDKENGTCLCQNSHLVHEPTHSIETGVLVRRYLDNPITKAVVFGGLEPLDTPKDLINFLEILRYSFHNKDDVVIYTGYTEQEVAEMPLFKKIISFGNIVIKYGRFRPDQLPHYDEVLGVRLASDNQYAKRY